MSNIFLLPPELGEEDRFTAYFHYAIDNISELGQAIVDFLLIQSGKSSSRFIKAVVHLKNGATYSPTRKLHPHLKNNGSMCEATLKNLALIVTAILAGWEFRCEILIVMVVGLCKLPA